MAQYRKKPIVIEAVQVTKEMRNEHGPFPKWATPHLEGGQTQKIENSGWLQCKTLEGPLNVSDGDYLIRGINGEIYPCKPDIFEKTYDALKEERELGMFYNIVIVTKEGESKRFEFDIPVHEGKITPPCIHWENKDGTNSIRTWITGYLKNK